MDVKNKLAHQRVTEHIIHFAYIQGEIARLTQDNNYYKEELAWKGEKIKQQANAISFYTEGAEVNHPYQYFFIHHSYECFLSDKF